MTSSGSTVDLNDNIFGGNRKENSDNPGILNDLLLRDQDMEPNGYLPWTPP